MIKKIFVWLVFFIWFGYTAIFLIILIGAIMDGSIGNPKLVLVHLVFTLLFLILSIFLLYVKKYKTKSQEKLEYERAKEHISKVEAENKNKATHNSL